MFYTPPSLFDPPTYPRKKLPLAGSPPEQARSQPQPEPTARVPYRPAEQASPRPPGNAIPLIFRALPHPSLRRPKAAAAAYSDAFPALQSQTQPASAPAPFQSPAQPQQTPPSASPATQSTEEDPKAAAPDSTLRDQSPTATAAAGQQLSTKPTDSTPQSPSQPLSTPAPAQSPAQPQQTPSTASPAPQSTEEAPKVAAAFKEAAAPQSPTTPAPQSPSPSPTPPAPPQPPAPPPQTPPTAAPAPQSPEEKDPKAVAAVNKATAQAEAADALRKQRAPRRTMLESAGLGGAATSLEALEDEVQARHAELEKKFPQHGPEYQAGMKAILQHIQQQQAQIKARADQLPEIAARIYQQWGKGVAGSWTTGQALRENDRDSPGAPLSESHLDALNQEAAKYGIDPKDLRHHLEMQRVSDWSRGDTSAAVRYGPGGSIWVNPDRYLDENAYRQAVEKAGGSEAEKAAAMSRFPELQQRAAKAQLDTLRTLGVYNQWEASQPKGMSDAEKLAKFRQEHSGIFSSGAWKVRMHQALLGVASAVVGLAKSAVGTYEAATRSPGALDLYEKLSRDAASISSSSAALPTGQLVHMGTSMVVSSAPSLGVGGLVSLTLKAGGAAFGLRTAAQVAQAAQTWGLRGAAATAGLQTFGGMYGDAVQGYMNRGDSESTALNKAFIPALAGAASTYLLTAAGGTQGIEALLRQPAFKENFRQWFKAVAAGSVKEGLREEAPDQLIQGIIERYTYNPDKPWKDIIEETLQAGIGGALLGGAAEATTTGLAPAKTSQDQPQPPIPSNTTPVTPDGSVHSSSAPPVQPTTPPKSVEDSKKLIENVSKMPPQAQQHPKVQADLNQAHSVVAEASRKLIENVSKMRPEAQQHPTVQKDLAQAKKVVQDHVQRLESQTTPLSDAQKKELADAKAALARTEQSLPNQQHVSGNTPTAEVNAPAPRFQDKNPELLEQHRKKLDSKRNAPRNAQSEAALLHVPDERARNAKPASDTLHRHNEAGALVKTGEMGGKHINEANILEAPDGNAALHKPDDGQSEKKIRAGVEPGTTGHREVAASKIAQALGIDLVPPTTMLTHDGRPGSAQVFKKGMINGKDASDPNEGHNIKIDSDTELPEGLPPDTAHDWQLTDDLLMHSDRHRKNYMLRVENGKIVEAALVDNGHSLPANTGVVEKRYPGPLEGQPISPLNEARLHRMLDNEESLRQSLKEHLEPEAIDGLFARAKALLARGTYGNFTLDEINAHLPTDKQRSRPAAYNDRNQ